MIDVNKCMGYIQRAADTLPAVAAEILNVADAAADALDKLAEMLEDLAENFADEEDDLDGEGPVVDEPTLSEKFDFVVGNMHPGRLTDSMVRQKDEILKHGPAWVEQTYAKRVADDAWLQEQQNADLGR